MSIEQKLLEIQALAAQLEEAKCMTKEADVAEAVSPVLKSAKLHTVDIDHMGGHDEHAKMHNITLKKTGTHSHNATGTKKNLQKFLTKHYDDHDDAKELHPEVFKEDYKIDLGGLFDGQELSEEFKGKAAAVFEAAVAVRVQQEVAELSESFAQKQLDEAVELKESLVDKVDGYLDYMVEQWMTKNELAINRGIKTEILESFVSGMKGLFESHYIDVPDEKYDLVEAKQEEVQTLEQRLDEQTAQIICLKQDIKDMDRKAHIDEACQALSDTDAERFRQLAEELSYSDSKEFRGKLNAVVESYFSANNSKSAKKVLAEEFMTDAPVEMLEESSASIDPLMAKYLKAIEKSGF